MSLDNEPGGLIGLSMFFRCQEMQDALVPISKVFSAWRFGEKLTFEVEVERKKMRVTIRPLHGEGCRTVDTAVDVESWDGVCEDYILDVDLTSECNECIKEGVRFLGGDDVRWVVSE